MMAPTNPQDSPPYAVETESKSSSIQPTSESEKEDISTKEICEPNDGPKKEDSSPASAVTKNTNDNSSFPRVSKRYCVMFSMISILISLIYTIPFVLSQNSNPLDEAWLENGYSLKIYYDAGSGVKARSLLRLPSGDILLIQARTSKKASEIVLLWDDDDDGVSDGSLSLIPSGHGLSHGIEYILPENNKWSEDGKGLLLASSDTTVWAWPFVDGQRVGNLGQGTVLVDNINARSNQDDLGAYRGHWTRTLALSPEDQRYLYVSVGSYGNVDADSFRSRIRRFDLWTEPTYNKTIYDFRAGEVFADGLRNEVGLAFDINNTLWGVENGADNLIRSDLGGDIHNENPAEELNRFDGEIGTHYGYPYCWTEYGLPQDVGKGPGTVWAWPSTMKQKDDTWCRENTQPPVLSMQAHSAPLGITFYDSTLFSNDGGSFNCKNDTGKFPDSVNGHAYVAFHGSWNRRPPTGYKVVQIPFDQPGGNPLGSVDDLMRYNGFGAKWPSGVRPVDVEFDKCGRLLVSDDGNHKIFTILYDSIHKQQQTNGAHSYFPFKSLQLSLILILVIMV